MSTHANPYITPEQYLEIERAAEFKSEYYDGEMFAMAGARRPHNLIVTNTVTRLEMQLLDQPCETYSNDMRIQAGTIAGTVTRTSS
ncbi:MAG TPA: Uma2 family endonuclease [Candidatus Solibacter sp.]|nr:Uma2 family endonuclease [Candidatus Solibacter sp.]